MPINIPDGLPAKKILHQERIFALEEEAATEQQIRPLSVAILNLMPTKIETETQILRLISKSPLQVSCDFMRVSSHESKNTSEDHLVKFYQTFDELKSNNYDGLIITGAPVGTIACYAVITVLNLIAMRRVLRRNAPKLLPNLWKTTIAAVLMGGTTWLAYWGLGRIGMGRAVACLGSIVVAVLVYVVLIIVLKVLTYEDCLLLPKGEKIAKILRVR